MGFLDSLFGRKKEKQILNETAPQADTEPETAVQEEEDKDRMDMFCKRMAEMKSVQIRTVFMEMASEEATNMLLDLYRQKPGGFLVDEEAAEPVREIGERLDKAGGMDLMLMTHQFFTKKCDEIGPGLARNLEMVWDHIGSWQG